MTLLFVTACETSGAGKCVSCNHLRLVYERVGVDTISDLTFDDMAHNNGVIEEICK